jgi:hypothetical protein
MSESERGERKIRSLGSSTNIVLGISIQEKKPEQWAAASRWGGCASLKSNYYLFMLGAPSGDLKLLFKFGTGQSHAGISDSPNSSQEILIPL